MKAKWSILISVILFWNLNASSQTTTEMVYLDGLMKNTSQENSAYKLELTKIGGDVFNGTIYDFSGEVKATGRYIKVNKRLLEDGHFTYYFANGQVESEGEFDRGVKVGNWKRYDTAGKRKADRYYPVESANKIREAMELEKSEDE
jgi:antitoxin component YwqK of YwqJK toxin-antitoxin module